MHLPLDQAEIRDVFFASQRLLQAGTVEELRRETLTTLQYLFQAEKGNFFLSNGDDHRSGLNLGKVVSSGISDKDLRLFRRYYHQLDPFKNILKSRIPQSQVMTFDQVMPFPKLIKTEYYNDFLKPQNIHDQLAIYLKSGNRFLGVTALFRPRSSPVFSVAEKAKAKLMVPFLTAAVERAMSIKKSRDLVQTIRSLTPDLPYDGIVILDRSLTPVYYNKAAFDIIACLHQSDGKHRSFPEDLPETLMIEAQKLSTAMNRSERKDIACTELKIPTRNHSGKITTHLRVLYNDDLSPKILICFNPTNKSLKPNSALRKMGISKRELDIVHLLAEGKKNSEIAASLFISEYTVENHLRSIYRKMDVKNRTALVCKVININA
ncbi:MAG: helix-turn-helix transcriptional regulator [Deltaproteobacteria bacterium]|nr:helix-turn-helix transcriptional regulator [Deltaproteobacteria bacterium]